MLWQTQTIVQVYDLYVLYLFVLYCIIIITINSNNLIVLRYAKSPPAKGVWNNLHKTFEKFVYCKLYFTCVNVTYCKHFKTQLYIISTYCILLQLIEFSDAKFTHIYTNNSVTYMFLYKYIFSMSMT